MVSDADRRTVYDALHDQLGERPASILMELLPPVTSTELARQSDLVAIRGEMAEFRGELGELRGELKGEMAELRGEMSELRAELKGEMSELRGEMAELRAEVKGDIAELRGEVRSDIAKLSARIDAQVPRFLVASLPMTLGFGGLVLAAAKLA